MVKLAMKVKNIIDEDFINYKKPSMFILTTKCSMNFKPSDFSPSSPIKKKNSSHLAFKKL